MKNYIYFLILSVVVLWYSCEEPDREAGFEDLIEFSAYDYIEAQNDSVQNFTSFLKILEAGGIDKTLSAYNPEGNGYTLFLPDNNAVDDFINTNEQFSSLNDILNNTEYARSFSRYHVLTSAVHSNDFPFGTFAEPTLTGDYLTVGFVIETDTSYYNINNQAPVIKANIEVSNGYIHQIQTALNPITFTTYGWLEQNPEFSIFKDAVDLTGLQFLVDINTVGKDNYIQPVTLLVEADSIYQKKGINSLSDLITKISPDRDNYTEANNPLYNYVGYHILSGSWFLNDFVDVSSNFTTYSEVPLNINGTGLDVKINMGKQMFDTLVYQGDTTFIDYIGFYYDNSNVITQSGAIHYIDRIMEQQKPSRARQNYDFGEEPYINQLRKEIGTFLIDDRDALQNISWSESTELFFVEMGNQESSAWGNDYLFMDGDFTISYEIPRIVQGKYEVYLRAEAFNNRNAFVEVFIDGKKLGGSIDLTRGGSASNPFQNIELGTIDFKRYSTHTIEVKPLIPGRFLWDLIYFVPF